MVLATFLSMIITSIKIDFVIDSIIKRPSIGFEVLTFIVKVFLLLEHIIYIYYLILFKNDQAKVYALSNFDNEINIINSTYIAKLGFKVQPTNVRTQKIDNSTFKKFRIISTSFQVKKKFKKALFFPKTFLLANINLNIVLNMLFLIFSNIKVLFTEQKLT